MVDRWSREDLEDIYTCEKIVISKESALRCGGGVEWGGVGGDTGMWVWGEKERKGKERVCVCHT